MIRKIRGLACVRNLFNNSTMRVEVIDGPGYVILEMGNGINSAGLTAAEARILADQLYIAAEIVEKREQCPGTAPCTTSKKPQHGSASSSSVATGGKATASSGG